MCSFWDVGGLTFEADTSELPYIYSRHPQGEKGYCEEKSCGLMALQTWSYPTGIVRLGSDVGRAYGLVFSHLDSPHFSSFRLNSIASKYVQAAKAGSS